MSDRDVASLIVRTPDEYEFTNPGSSRLPEAELRLGNHSDPRNPILAKMFRYIGVAEEAGTGIPKIIEAWRKLGLRMAAIDIGTEKYEFRLSLRHVHLLPDEDREWLLSIGEGWSESEQLALVAARRNEVVDRDTLAGLTGLHPADCTAVLKRLRASAYLSPADWGGRTRRYVLGPKAHGAPRLRLITDGTPGAGEVSRTASELPQTTVKLPQMAGELLQTTPEPLHMVDEPLQTTVEPLQTMNSSGSSGGMPVAPSEEVALLHRIAGSKRLPRSTVEAAILTICTGRFVRAKEIAAALQRSVDIIGARYLTPMLARGALEQQYPATPNYPAQAYRARGGDDA